MVMVTVVEIICSGETVEVIDRRRGFAKVLTVTDRYWAKWTLALVRVVTFIVI
jgi:hypothetical protein